MLKIVHASLISLWAAALLWSHHTGWLWLFFEDLGWLTRASTGARFFFMLVVHVAAGIAFLVLGALLSAVFGRRKKPGKSFLFSALSLTMVVCSFNLMIFADSVIEIRREDGATECPYSEARRSQWCFFVPRTYVPLAGSLHGIYGSLGGKAGGIREPWYRFYIALRDPAGGGLYLVDLGTEFVDRHKADARNLQAIIARRKRMWHHRPARPIRLILSRKNYAGGSANSYIDFLRTNRRDIPALGAARIPDVVFAVHRSSVDVRDIFWYIKRIGLWLISLAYALLGLLFVGLTLFSGKKK